MKTHRATTKWLILAVMGALAIAWLIIGLWPRSGMAAPPLWRAHADGAPLVLAHQGGAMERPSSSDLAFERASEIGVDAFELDVVLTADGVLAVIHDTTLDRTTDGVGPVGDRTYAEIRFLDAGYGLLGEDGEVVRDPARNPYIGIGAYVPSLEELFREYPSMPMLIEIKDSSDRGLASARELRRLIDAYGRATTTMVACNDEEPLLEFDSLPGERVARAASKPEAYRFYARHALGLNALNNRAPHEAMSLSLTSGLGPFTIDLTAERLRRDCVARGLSTMYWTVNDVATMERLLSMATSTGGIDGIITDRPSELLAALSRRGIR
ncbi:MAG TPA: glycerophosphodiester phosphodiesterase family protein [Spirochaetales bacterium]|nr:glycerophosphodiester phosphodiesterase family protein [Spirochaetales bacterium]